MEKPETSPQAEQADPVKVFESLSGYTLVPIDYDQVPEVVRTYIEQQSAWYIPRDQYVPRNFQKLYSFTFPNGDVGYVAEQDKDYGNEAGIERLTYFVDTREGVETGHLELRYNLVDQSAYCKDKPFVGYTRTTDDFQRHGLAERRLHVANAYALAHYRAPLNSDTRISDEEEHSARRVWERLVERGEAEMYQEGRHDRFRFLSK